jgi:hypothetical protein
MTRLKSSRNYSQRIDRCLADCSQRKRLRRLLEVNVSERVISEKPGKLASEGSLEVQRCETRWVRQVLGNRQKALLAVEFDYVRRIDCV